MASSDLYCNFKKCHKTLSSTAWVTSCSHAFCDDHGLQELETERKCPACSLDLSRDYDVVKANLNPTEEFKSMVLAGLRPETVLDMMRRSFSFWSYQMSQEKNYHVLMMKHWKERCAEFESAYQTLMVKVKNDRDMENKKLEDLRTDLSMANRTIKELEEKLSEKSRLAQNLQSKYEIMLRSGTKQSDSDDFGFSGVPQISRVTDTESFLQCRPRLHNNRPPSVDNAKKDFFFQPINTLPDY